MDLENKIIIDWFSFTTSICSPQNIIELLGMEECPWVETHGFYGWTNRLSFDHISIMYGGDFHDNLVMLEMSGQGCRVFETLGHGNFNALFSFIIENKEECKVTRLDVAFDDFTGLLNLDEIIRDTYKGNFISRFRVPPEIHSKVYPDGHCGHTVTHGKRDGSVFIRIYDKAVERNKTDEIKHWVRCELQLRCGNCKNSGNRAEEFIRLMVEDNETIDNLYFAVLNHYLRYVKPSDTDSNKWRFELADHWSDFYNFAETTEKSIYKAPGMEYNAIKLRKTYGERFGGGIYTYIQIFGVDTLLADIEKCKPKLNPKYKLLLAEDEELKKVNCYEPVTSI